MANFRYDDDLRDDDDDRDSSESPQALLDVTFNTLAGTGTAKSDELLNILLQVDDINRRQAFEAYGTEEYVGSKPSALHVAAQYADISAVRTLIEFGADPNLKDDLGFTPLHVAVFKDRPDLVRTLLQGGADPDLPFEGREAVVYDETHASPLHIAVRNASLETVAELLAFKARVDPKDSEGVTPLQLAVRESKLSAADALIRAGADVNTTDNNGQAPLLDVLQPRYFMYEKGIARLLIKSGASVDGPRNGDGKTARDLIREQEDSALLGYVDRHGRIRQAAAQKSHESNLEALDRILSGRRRPGPRTK